MAFNIGIAAYLNEYIDADYKNNDLKTKIRLCDTVFRYSHRISPTKENSKKRNIQLLEEEDDPSHSDNCGRSLLHKAIVDKDAEMVRHLIQEGADVHALDCVGNTPLHLACNPPNYEVAKLLCDAGANPMISSTAVCNQSPYSIIQGQLRRYSSLAKCSNEHSKLSLEKFKRLLQSSQSILEMFSRWRDASSEREITDRGLSGLLGEVDMLGLMESTRVQQSIDQELTNKVACIGIAPSFTEWRQPRLECESSHSDKRRLFVSKPVEALNTSIGAISLNDNPSSIFQAADINPIPTNNVSYNI